jgi:hypothetical protein
VGNRKRGHPEETPLEDIRSYEDVDEALGLATTRITRAQHDFVDTPPGTTDSVHEADHVVHRAEELDTLAVEAVEQARESSDSEPA